jgi:hypothetical protein
MPSLLPNHGRFSPPLAYLRTTKNADDFSSAFFI